MNIVLLLILLLAPLMHLGEGQECMRAGDGICSPQITHACIEFLEKTDLITNQWPRPVDHPCSSLTRKIPKISHGLIFEQGREDFGRGNGELKAPGYFSLTAQKKLVYIIDVEAEERMRADRANQENFELLPACQNLLEQQIFSIEDWVTNFSHHCPSLAKIILTIADKLRLEGQTIILRARQEYGFSVKAVNQIITISFNFHDLRRRINALKGALAHELCHVKNGDTNGYIDPEYVRRSDFHNMEYAADICSARTIGAEAMRASLELSSKSRTMITRTHPSILSRIAKIALIQQEEDAAKLARLSALEIPLVPCICDQ